jgi:gliding motility-associated-like protein
MKMHNGGANHNNGYFSSDSCIDSLYAFTYNLPKSVGIKSIYGLPCSDGLINVDVTAQDGYPPYTYLITEKDGSPYNVNNGSNGLFQNLPKGIYMFTIVDSCGNSINRKFEITKLSLPKIDAQNICDGQTGKLSVLQLPAMNYKWWKKSNPSNIISNTYYYDFAPFHIATDTGTYYVVMASTLVGVCVSDTITIHISSNLINPNSGNDTTVSICRTANMINLSDYLSSDADKNGTWYEVSNSNLLADNYWFPSLISAGTYQFEYITNGLCSGADTSHLTVITVDTPLSPIISDITNQTCASGGSAIIGNLPENGTWIISLNTNDTIINGTGSSYLLSGLKTGIDTIQISSIAGCSSDKAIFDIPFTGNLNLQITSKTSDTICYGNSSNIVAQTNGTQISWTPAAGLSDTGIATPAASPQTSTVYHITSTLGLCTQTDSVLIIVNPLPIAVVDNDTTICPYQNTQLYGSGGILYEWSPSSFLSNKNSPNPTVIQPTYNIIYSLKVTDTNGCTSNNSAQTGVNLYPQVVVGTQYTSDVSFEEQTQLQAVDVNNVGIADYLWSPPDGLSDVHIANPVLTVGSIENYIVTATSKDGCTGTGNVVLKIYAKPDLFVPSAFTPNGDMLNDVFKPIPISIKELTFAVYNRYGNKLIETPEQNKGWDGTFNGTKQPAGTYVWYAEAVTLYDEKIFKKGTVVLIR